jgi:hypothetical protein
MVKIHAIMKWKRVRPWLARLAARGDRLGLVSMNRWLAMDKNAHAFLPILFERGIDSSVLIIAFSGGAQKLDVPIHEFFATTKTLGYDRILLRDKYTMYYHYGVDRKRRDWPRLLEYLTQEIARLKPEKLICVGTSSGGYAAIVAGHHLRADFVHAFGPQTKIALDREGIRNARHPVHRWRMSLSTRVLREALDLVPMLQQGNGKTRYFVHYGSGHDIDRCFAERISFLPGVTTIGYPSAAHAIAVFLAKKRFLGRLLDIENQHRLAEMARHHFDQARITLPYSGAVPKDELLSEDIPLSHPLTT